MRYCPFAGLLRLAAVGALALPGCGDPDPAGALDAAPPGCRPTGGGPHWLVELDEISFSVSCSGQPSEAPGAFSIADLPEGATWNPTEARLSWTPGLDQAAVYRLTIVIDGSEETGQVTIGVADHIDHPDNVPVVDPTRYSHEFGIPVIFVSPAPTVEDPYMPIDLVHGGVTYQAEGKLRGASSLDYPKNSYTFKFDAVRFTDTDSGLRDRERIVLTSTFDDNSYVRQWMAFQLWNQLEPTIEIQAHPVVLYADGQYHGLYLMTDHINGQLMKISSLSDNGNLYKAVNHDANFRTTTNGGNAKDTLHDGFEKKEGQPEHGEAGAYDDLDQLVSLVAESSTDQFRQTIVDEIDLGDYFKWLILVSYIRADDSAGKNSYHYHDATRSWRVVPWDFNASFGQSWQTRREPAQPVSLYQDRNYLFHRLLADETLADQLWSHYRAALDGPLSATSVRELLEDNAQLIDFAARRDWSRWGDSYRNFSRWSDRTDWTDYDGELDYLRLWLATRAQAIDDLVE